MPVDAVTLSVAVPLFSTPIETGPLTVTSPKRSMRFGEPAPRVAGSSWSGQLFRPGAVNWLYMASGVLLDGENCWRIRAAAAAMMGAENDVPEDNVFWLSGRPPPMPV